MATVNLETTVPVVVCVEIPDKDDPGGAIGVWKVVVCDEEIGETSPYTLGETSGGATREDELLAFELMDDPTHEWPAWSFGW